MSSFRTNAQTPGRECFAQALGLVWRQPWVCVSLSSACSGAWKAVVWTLIVSNAPSVLPVGATFVAMLAPPPPLASRLVVPTFRQIAGSSAPSVPPRRLPSTSRSAVRHEVDVYAGRAVVKPSRSRPNRCTAWRSAADCRLLGCTRGRGVISRMVCRLAESKSNRLEFLWNSFPVSLQVGCSCSILAISRKSNPPAVKAK